MINTVRALGLLLGALALSGCGAKPTGPLVIASMGVGGCPDADDVQRARYGSFGGEQYGAPDDGWYVELGWRAADATSWSDEDGQRAGTLQPGPQNGFTLAGAALQNPRTATVYSPDWPDGCQGNVTGVYGVRGEDPSPFVVAYATIAGCQPDGVERVAHGWAVPDQGASSCAFAVPTSHGRYDYEADLAGVPPVPAPWAALVQASSEPCDDCALLWDVREVEGVEPAVSELTTAWMPPDVDACDYFENAHHVYAAAGAGALAAVAGTERYVLDGVLHDGGRAALVLVRNATRFHVLPVSDTEVMAAVEDAERGQPHHEEDSEYFGLTAYCGP